MDLPDLKARAQELSRALGRMPESEASESDRAALRRELAQVEGKLSTLALASKPGHLWTYEEECAASDLLGATPEPLPETYVRLLFTLGDAEELRLRRGGATSADLDD